MHVAHLLRFHVSLFIVWLLTVIEVIAEKYRYNLSTVIVSARHFTLNMLKQTIYNLSENEKWLDSRCTWDVRCPYVRTCIQYQFILLYLHIVILL